MPRSKLRGVSLCPDDRSKRYLYRYVQKTLEYAENIKFYLSTWNYVQEKGMNREVLERVEEKED